VDGGLVQQLPAPLFQGRLQPLPGPFRPGLGHEGAEPGGLPLGGVLGHQLQDLRGLRIEHVPGGYRRVQDVARHDRQAGDAAEETQEGLEARGLGEGLQGAQQAPGLLQGQGQHQIAAAQGRLFAGRHLEAALNRPDGRYPRLQADLQPLGQVARKGLHALGEGDPPHRGLQGARLAGRPSALHPPGPVPDGIRVHLAQGLQEARMVPVREQGTEIHRLAVEAPGGAPAADAMGPLQDEHLAPRPLQGPRAAEPRHARAHDDGFQEGGRRPGRGGIGHGEV